MHTKRDFKSFDFMLFGLVAILSVIGIIVIRSATGVGTGEATSETLSIYRMQLVWVPLGFLLMLFVAFVDYRFICKFYIVFYIICIFLLLLVLFKGTKINNTYRWLRFEVGGFSAGIQPSEFAKIFLLIFLAKYIDKMHEKINNILVLLSAAALGALPVVLTVIQPSLSAAILLLVIVFVMLFIAKINYRYIVAIVLIAAPIVGFLYYDLNRDEYLLLDKIFKDYQIESRLKPFFGLGEIDEGDTYQTNQSVRAIGSGMLTGKGLNNNVTYVPYSYNDFIFAVIGAEFGFAGCMGLLFLIILVVIKCFLVARNADSLCGKLLAAGVGAMIGCQTFVHVGVTTGILPNTGIPLPFISAGGSSMWINLAAIGLVISVGMTKTKLMFAD